MARTKLLNCLLFLAALVEVMPAELYPLPFTETKPKANMPTVNKRKFERAIEKNTGTTDLMDLITYTSPDEVEENGGYRFGRPGKHKAGRRHVHAHDGFHNLKREPKWAHWNDAFTTTPKPLTTN